VSKNNQNKIKRSNFIAWVKRRWLILITLVLLVLCVVALLYVYAKNNSKPRTSTPPGASQSDSSLRANQTQDSDKATDDPKDDF